MENIVEEIVALIESKKDDYANRVEVSSDDLMIQMFQKQKQSISPEMGAQYIEKFAKILEEKGIIIKYKNLSQHPFISQNVKNIVILFGLDKDLWKVFYDSFSPENDVKFLNDEGKEENETVSDIEILQKIGKLLTEKDCKNITIKRNNKGEYQMILAERHIDASKRLTELQYMYPHADIQTTIFDGKVQYYTVIQKIK